MDAFKKQQPKKTLFKRVILPIIITLLIAGILVGLFFLLRPVYYRQLEKTGIENTEQSAEIALKLKYAGMQTSAITVLEHGADAGNCECQCLLAKYYAGESPFDRYVDSVNRDDDKASYWFLQAAKNGCIEAYAEIAFRYKHANGVDLDLEKCVKWLKKGAEAGSASAQYELGNCYETGLYRYKYKNNDGSLGSVYFIGYHGLCNIPHYKFCSKMNQVWYDIPEDSFWRIKDIYCVYLEKNLDLAREWWARAAEQGHEGAKTKIQKIYKGDE